MLLPRTGNHILVSSEYPQCDPREWGDSDDFNREFTDQWTHQTYRMGQRIPKLPVSAGMSDGVELYDVSDDWLPIYVRSSVDGFYMAVGTSGNQFKNAPVVGRMMANLIACCEADNDHDAAPTRYPLERVNHTLAPGSFSRPGEITVDSSFSVLG